MMLRSEEVPRRCVRPKKKGVIARKKSTKGKREEFKANEEVGETALSLGPQKGEKSDSEIARCSADYSAGKIPGYRNPWHDIGVVYIASICPRRVEWEPVATGSKEASAQKIPFSQLKHYLKPN